MRVTETGDPRLEALFGDPNAPVDGVRPVVRLPGSGVPGWAITLIATVAAVLLFVVLELHRTTQPQPSLEQRSQTQLAPEPPPLYIPPAPVPAEPEGAPALPPAPGTAVAPVRPPFVPERAVAPPQALGFPETNPATPLPQARSSAGPALVIDNTVREGATSPSTTGVPVAPQAGGLSAEWGGRVRSSSLASRADTVPQGVLIPAVLETGFDSTSAGLARAIVSKDVRGFDGTKVLIPRGSRLIGEYGAEVASGQKRALITWTRLIRPDGVTIALDSPATDTLGGAGVPAHVNSHFFTRFLDAILRTSLDVGGMLATRAASGSVIIAAPGLVQNSATPQTSTRSVPTLTVQAGTSISIFVARDLEFPHAEPLQ